MRYWDVDVGRRLTVCGALIGLLAIGCQPQPGRLHTPPPARPLAQLAPCTPPPQGTAGWQLVSDTFGFEFRLPPGYSEIHAQGVDSHVRHFATSDARRTIHLDYGRFSSTLDEYRGSAEFVECRGEIGGHATRVVTAREGGNAYVTAVTWRDLTPGAHLTVAGVTRDRAGRLEIEAALWSMRFRAP